MINKNSRTLVFTIIFFFVISFFIRVFVDAAPNNNPVFATIQYVQQAISNALDPIQESLNDLTERVTELEASVTPIPAQISNLQDQIDELNNKIASIESKLTPAPTPTASLTPFPTPILSGLVSWWPGEGSGADNIGPNNGSLVNGVTFVSGKIGQAFNFNSNNYVQASSSNLPTGSSNRTIVLWVKINSFLADISDPQTPLETFFAGYGNFGSGGQSYAIGTVGNLLYFSSWGPVIFGPSLQTGTWYHVAVKNVGNDVTLYLNGLPVADSTLSINTSTNSNFYIGRIPGTLGDTRKLNGIVDEVTVYNRALSSSEILSLYNN